MFSAMAFYIVLFILFIIASGMLYFAGALALDVIRVAIKTIDENGEYDPLILILRTGLATLIVILVPLMLFGPISKLYSN